MLQQFVIFAINALLSLLTKEKINSFILAGYSKIEDYIKSTPTEIDDKLILPAIRLVLAALEVPADGKINIDSELKKLFYVLGNDLRIIFIDAGLDYIEDAVIASENKIDDAVVLPACKLVRTVLNIPDND